MAKTRGRSDRIIPQWIIITLFGGLITAIIGAYLYGWALVNVGVETLSPKNFHYFTFIELFGFVIISVIVSIVLSIYQRNQKKRK